MKLRGVNEMQRTIKSSELDEILVRREKSSRGVQMGTEREFSKRKDKISPILSSFSGATNGNLSRRDPLLAR